MKRIKQLLRRIRFVYRRSSNRTRIVVMSAIVLSMAALIALNLTIAATQNRTNDLTDQAGKLEQENSQLEEKVENIGTAEGVIQAAKDLWGLIFPDTVVIEPED